MPEAFLALARHIPIVLLTPAGVVRAVTEAAERVLARRRRELEGRVWHELCADPEERTREYLGHCARTLAPIPGAFRLDDGGAQGRFRCEGYLTVLPSDERVIVLQVRRQVPQDSFILLGQKIAELNTEILRRKESERRLAEALGREQQAQARLATILDHLPAGVMIAEAPDGKIVYANEGRQAWLRATDRAQYPETFAAWSPDGRRYREDDYPLVKALGGEHVVAQEIHFRREDGDRAIVLANAAPVRDPSGTIVAAVTTYYDVTEQKRLQEAELAARNEAEAANRAKDDFLAMLGHELRNPLAPILTALHLMRLRDDGMQKERTVIERQVKHLVRLVDDLLDMSRITSGKVELVRQRVELGTVVARAIEMASPFLEKRQQTLELAVPSHGLVLDVDPARLAQVVFNVLGNAAKYSESGATIWISARREDDTVVFQVRDSGIGITPDMLARVFDRFVQERQALDRSYGGLGLGLAIVRSLVELHGGTVAIHSEGRGRGTELTIRLPLASADEPAASASPTEEPIEPAVARGLRVLVVDDNEDGAEMLSRSLEALGYVVRVAHDGPSALRAAAAFAPELALLDIGLPVMDGYEVAERLRQEPGLANILLVAITGYGQESDRQRSRAAGFHAHLVKPVGMSQLKQVLETLLAAPA